MDIEISSDNIGSNKIFEVNNMFPGDEETGKFCVKVFYKENVIVKYNAFILPYDKNDIANLDYNLQNEIEYCGFAESDWRKKITPHNYEKIALIFVDTKYLIDCYFKKDKFEIQSLIKSIEKVINQ